MLIIPELETILILPPKTASTSIIEAIKNRYPNSFQIYRHMEADGIPYGYKKWKIAGVVREPFSRLFSMYNYSKIIERPGFEEYVKAIRESANKYNFSDWVINNKTIFTSPNIYTSSRYEARYTIYHSIPENYKTQHIYLRPDLGTKIYNFHNLSSFQEDFDVKLSIKNFDKNKHYLDATDVTNECINHINFFHTWERKIYQDRGLEWR